VFCGAAEENNLLKNGDFSKFSEKSIEGWGNSQKVKVELIESKPTLILDGSYSHVSQTIEVKPEWQTLRLSMLMKASDIKIGDASWKDGRLVLVFKDKDGKKVGGWPKVFSVKGTTDWVKCERDYDIPAESVSLDVVPSMFGASGILEFQDIKLTVWPKVIITADHRPVIILKLDDVVRVTGKWNKCVEFLKEEKVKASLGIIGYSMAGNDQKLFDWIKAQNNTGMFEFWNHGYHNRSGKDKKGEFESDSAEEQRTALLNTQKLVKEKTGISLAVFGPHWSGTTAATVEALKGVPEIKSVFYYTGGAKRDWFIYQRFTNMEIPTFKPNFALVKKNFEGGEYKRPYLCLQGHPNSWTDDSFENFKQIVKYFKEQGCEFMTASEYVKANKLTEAKK
jgi:hypothetical protein